VDFPCETPEVLDGLRANVVELDDVADGVDHRE